MKPSEEGSTGEEPGQNEISRRRDQLLGDARRAADGVRKPSGGEGASGSALAGLGMQFVITILLCIYAGRWLDGKVGTAPWLLIAGAVLGTAAGFFVMFRVLRSANADDRGGTSE